MNQETERRVLLPASDVAAPDVLTMYPGCTPRPRDRRAYEAACAAAEGQLVREFNASQIKRGQRVWCCGSFLTVVNAWIKRLGDIKDLENQINEADRIHQFVLLQLEGDGSKTGWLIGELNSAVYVLANTIDAQGEQ